MHILHVNQHYWPYDRGGSGISTRELAEAQVAAGDRVTVLAQAPGDRDETHRRAGVEALHLAVAQAPPASIGRRRGLAARALGQLWPEMHPGLPALLRRALIELQPDVLHTHVLAGVSTRIWRVARQLGIPVVHTLRDYYLLCARGTMLRGGQRCARSCGDCRLLTRTRREHGQMVDAAVGISRFILERHLQQGVFRGASIRRVISNGISTTAQPPRPSPDGRCRIGFLGRLHPSKGPQLLIDAVREAGDPRLVLHIGGTGRADFESQLRARAGGLPVEFHGAVDAGAFLAGIDVLAVSSLFEEPFGRIIIEAFGQGVPVICARRGGAQELVTQDRTGWLFEPDAPESLAAVLRRVADGIPPATRERCLQAAGAYRPAVAAAAYRALYGDVLAQAGMGPLPAGETGTRS